MSTKVVQIRAEVEPELGLELAKWARNDEGRSTRRHCSILLERLARLKRRGSESLSRMDSGQLLRELDLVR